MRPFTVKYNVMSNHFFSTGLFWKQIYKCWDRMNTIKEQRKGMQKEDLPALYSLLPGNYRQRIYIVLNERPVETMPLTSTFLQSASVESQSHRSKLGRNFRDHEIHILIP